MSLIIIFLFLCTYLSFNLLLLSTNSIRTALIINIFLGLLFTRPNILGESFGFIQPIFWLLAYYFSQRYNNPSNKSYKVDLDFRRFRRGITFPIFIFYTAYWAYSVVIDSLRGNSISIWVIFSNTVGLLSGIFAINAILLKAESKLIINIYCWFVLLPSVGNIIKYILPTVIPCFDYNFQHMGGRSMTYNFCMSGSVYIGNRFTGFGGEPAIFSTELALCVFLILNIPVYKKQTTWIIGIILSLGVIQSFASTGYFVLIIALWTSLLKITTKRSRVFASTLFILMAVLFYRVMVVLFHQKVKTAPLSISDRFTFTSTSDYIDAWSMNFFGNMQSDSLKNSGINLLSLSLLYGFPIIIFTASFLVRVFLNLRRIVPFNGPLIIIIFTMF